MSERRHWFRRAVAALLFAVGCSKTEMLPEAPISKVTEEAVSQIIALMSPEGTHPAVIRELDVRRMSAGEFKQALLSVAADQVTVWMPGESRWLVIGWNGTNRVSLARALETFAVDDENAAAVPDVFASYAGTREEILPAFAFPLEGMVVPEWFLTREIPPLAWLDSSEVDADIRRATLSEIRSMQVVRRLILEGNMAARIAKDKKGEEDAADKWSRAFLRNPRDPMLRERLDNLSRNATGFLEVGKVLQAMKCFETMILINPKDAVAVHNFGICLKRIGKADLAEKVLKRAETLGAVPAN